MATIDSATGEVLPALPPASEKREKKKRERRETHSTSLDIAKLLKGALEENNRAFENGGASARLDGEATAKLLAKEREAHAETTKKYLVALDAIEKAAVRNATLEVFKGRRDFELKQLELSSEQFKRVETMVVQAIPILAPHLARMLPGGGQKTVAESASDGSNTGKAALLRLIVKLIDNPQYLEMVKEFCGLKDWNLIVAFVQQIGQQDAEERERTNAA